MKVFRGRRNFENRVIRMSLAGRRTCNVNQLVFYRLEVGSSDKEGQEAFIPT